MVAKIKNAQLYLVAWLIALSFLLRLVSAYFVHDSHIDNEWNILLNNLINYRTFAYYTFDGHLIPSVYMPPIYPFFLYSIKIITNLENINLVYFIIFIQIAISTYSVYLFYQLNQNFFSNKISLINSFAFSIIPLNIYSSGQISSINLQIFLSIIFLKFLLLILKKQTQKNILIFSIVSGLLILTRGEFILIFILITIFLILNKKIKFRNLIIMTSVVFLVISPYLVRNYIHFNQIILVKSLGYNLWKGNNELSSVEGYENLDKTQFKNLKSEIDNLKKNNYYEIKRDRLFLNAAIDNLSKDLYLHLQMFIKKLFSFYFIDLNSTYPNYYNFFHIFPIIVLSVLSLPGLFLFFKMDRFQNKCLGLYLFLNLFIFSLFFILPRYKLIILPIQIILASYFIVYILKKLRKNSNLFRS